MQSYLRIMIHLTCRSSICTIQYNIRLLGLDRTQANKLFSLIRSLTWSSPTYAFRPLVQIHISVVSNRVISVKKPGVGIPPDFMRQTNTVSDRCLAVGGSGQWAVNATH